MAPGSGSTRPFRYDAGVDHRAVGYGQHGVDETYLDRPVERPETATDGTHAGPNRDT